MEKLAAISGIFSTKQAALAIPLKGLVANTESILNGIGLAKRLVLLLVIMGIQGLIKSMDIIQNVANVRILRNL